MALHDRYQRGDGRVQALDRYLTRLGDRAGNAWFLRTGVSRSVLTKGLYLFSAWASAQQFVIFRDPYAVWFLALALFGLTGIGVSRGGVVEQMQMEVLRLPRDTFAFLRIFLLVIGLFGLAQAAGLLLGAVAGGTELTSDFGAQLLSGFAITALQASEYIRRTNPTWPSRGGHWLS
ncbi:MAG TPA: hypothetical protein VH482_16320 [Thermomicrobiales bacterium]|jgi:hypothetical protein